MQVLRRIDPTRNKSRFYALGIVASVFGETILIRRWATLGHTVAGWRCGLLKHYRHRRPLIRLFAQIGGEGTAR